MRAFLLTIATLTSGCSAASAGGTSQYDRAVECELLTGTLAAFHPSISRMKIIELQQGNAHYNREAERLGAVIKKSVSDVDSDRRTFLVKLQKELTDSNAESVTNAKIKIAEACVSEIN